MYKSGGNNYIAKNININQYSKKFKRVKFLKMQLETNMHSLKIYTI